MMLRLSPSPLDAELAKLSLIVSSAEHLPPRLWQALEERYAPVANIYGMSETVNGGLFALPWDQTGYDTVGRPIDMQASVRDEAGNDTQDGSVGLLYLKGSSLFDGYESGATFTPAPLADGWFATADLALRRPEGSFEIIGRADEARNIGGVLVHPREIDDAIASLPYVRASKTLMLAVEGAVAELAPVSFVETDDPQAVETLKAGLVALLAPARLPREIVPQPRLPVTAAGKVDRIALERARATLAAAGAAVPSKGSIDTEIVLVAARVLNASPQSLSLASSHGSTYGWDSFGHINLALAIERHFGIRLSYAEVTSSASLADFAAIARERCAARE